MTRPSPALLTALAGCLALAAAMGFGRFAYTPLLPPTMQALGLTETQAGLIASANFAGYLAGALAAAAPGIARHARAWLLAGLAASVATTAAMALTTDPALMAGLRFLGGAASAFVLVYATAAVLDALGARSAPGLASVHFAGVGAGIAASAALIWMLTKAGADWWGLWIACGAASAVMALAAATWLPGGGEGSGPTKLGTEDLSGLSRLAPLLAAYGLFGFGYVITATFIVAMVRGSASGREVEPLVWLAVGLTAAPSVWVWLRLGAGLGLRRALTLACLAEAIGVAISAVAPGGWGALAAAALLGATFMGITALGLALARELTPGRGATAVAAMTAVFGLGQIIGPAAAGLWAERAGGFAGPSLAAAAALVMAAGLALLTPLPPVDATRR